MVEKHNDASDNSLREAVTLRLCGFCETWNSKPCGEQCHWLPTDPTIEQMRVKNIEAMRKHCHSRTREDILRSALLDIKHAHVPDQPASSQADETAWVMQHVGFIRGIASKALAEAAQVFA